MGSPSFIADLDHPLAAALVRFNLQPTRLYPASRRSEWLHPAIQGLDPGAPEADLHRHASAQIVRNGSLGMDWSFEEPSLPLCLCDDPLFEQLVLGAGLTLLAPRIRRVIGRAEVACLREQLGAEGLEFARFQAPAWDSQPVEGPTDSDFDPARAREQALALGAALLVVVFNSAAPAVGRRGLMRLPLHSDRLVPDLPPALLHEGVALSLARSILRTLDHSWLSFFPDIH